MCEEGGNILSTEVSPYLLAPQLHNYEVFHFIFLTSVLPQHVVQDEDEKAQPPPPLSAEPENEPFAPFEEEVENVVKVCLLVGYARSCCVGE